ncbi:hypothetical protein BACCIP111899_00586 [Bacillus rhizoplanae]|uniref:Uncharacterized protein n=1 Tax=Bacillus rhizoplanae TaxID=2880966 RepID=A0ABM8Y6Q9_9BACI|nr:hypothetical protein [Bacillus rhizoplanae]CAG9611415.1 hypothetical protein BACCIP111899_00586 [Bacillus rhizoplanae]
MLNYDIYELLLLEKSRAVYQYLLKLGIETKEAEDIPLDSYGTGQSESIFKLVWT